MKKISSYLLVICILLCGFTFPPHHYQFKKEQTIDNTEKIKKYLFGNVLYYSALTKKIDKFGDEAFDYINFGAMGAECKFTQDGSKLTFVNGNGRRSLRTCKIENGRMYLTDEKGNKTTFIVSLESYGVKAVQSNHKEIKANAFGVAVGYIFHKSSSINFK